MAKSKKLKEKSTWKPVEISGNLISGSDDFDGFAGLEVLESYDASFLSGDSKKRKVILYYFSRILLIMTSDLQDFSISELEGDIYDGRKRKSNDSDEENQEFVEKPLKKKSKQKKEKSSIVSISDETGIVKKSAKKKEVAEKPPKKKITKQKIDIVNAPGKYVLLKNAALEEDVDESLKLDEIFQVS